MKYINSLFRHQINYERNEQELKGLHKDFKVKYNNQLLEDKITDANLFHVKIEQKLLKD